MRYSLDKHIVTNLKTDVSFSFFPLLFVLVLFSRKAIATDTLTQANGISFGQTIISSGQVSELGFFSPGNSNKQYIGIWYKNIYPHRVLWVANRESPLFYSDSNPSLTIGRDGNLILLDWMNDTVWSTSVDASQTNNRIAVLLDNGNLILKDNVTGLTSWESFDYPGDTSFAGIIIGTNYTTGKSHYLSSWKREDDPFLGVYLLGLTTETPPQIIVWKSSKLYWRSGPWDGSKFIGIANSGVGYINGLAVTRDSQQKSAYVSYNPPSLSHVAIIRLAPDGNLVRSDWDLIAQQGGVSWQSIEVPCDVYGTCGPYGICDRSMSLSCNCLKGFVPKSMEEWEKGKWTSGCVRRTQLLCERNTSTLATRKKEKDVFWKASLMKLPDKFIYFYNLNSSDCKEWCLSNCTCKAYAYPDGIGCMVWDGDLVDTKQYSSGGADLFLRLDYSELDEKRKYTTIFIILAAIPSVILLGVFLFGLHRCKPNQTGEDMDQDTTLLLGSQTDSSDIRMHDFNMLAVATNNFSDSNKIGVGGFGPVYKGKLEDGTDIAVKRLSRLSGQGVEEFKNEILMISKLQHRNLVRLLGYCIKRDEKLLIYEYLKNRSLDTWLFDKKSVEQLDWAKRCNIIHGIARGILYLHRDSRLRIIHRDLKASNILLDDNMHPKITDFGLARSFQITQEQAMTNRVVGTFGYMSPEYAMGGQVSEKSDVYSFGVLLLEIISGMRITNFYDDGNLLYYAWHLWEEGKAIEFMDQALFSSCSDAELIQCMHIGLLCIQDQTIDRPSMSTVVFMLTSEIDLPQPKQPIFYKNMVSSGVHSQSSRNFYMTIVDDNANVVTLPPLRDHTHVHDSKYPTPQHSGSQPIQTKNLSTTKSQEMKIKAI